MSATHPFGRAIEAGDEDAALATLADDVVFRSPAVYKPYQGRKRSSSSCASSRPCSRTSATRTSGATADDDPFFEANVGDRELQGVDILEENEDGKIAAFTVMIRPLSGLQAVPARWQRA